MKKNLNRFFLLLITGISLVLNSCSKNTNASSNLLNSDSNIYIAGKKGDAVVLWNKGVIDTLSDNGNPNQVLVTGNDVYVAGLINNFSGYWKNGIPNIISQVNACQYNSVSVSGNSVVFASSVIGADYWINNQMVILDSSGIVTSSIVSGTDIYVAGSDGVGNAVYWKNNIKTILAYGINANPGAEKVNPVATCICVSGTDVYVGGSIGNTAVIWKNGLALPLKSTIPGTTATQVNSIFVSGSDVYATAIELYTGYTKTASSYWKNGTSVNLSSNGSANSIFVTGSDVYITGINSTTGAFWKNGTAYNLPIDIGNSIFVK